MKSELTLKSSLIIVAMALGLPIVSPAASITTTPNPTNINLAPGITLQDTATLSGFSSFPNTLTFTCSSTASLRLLIPKQFRLPATVRTPPPPVILWRLQERSSVATNGS